MKVGFMKIRSDGNGNLIMSKVTGTVLTLIMFASFVFGTAMAWINTTEINPIKSRVLKLEETIAGRERVDKLSEKIDTLTMQLVQHEKEQNSKLGEIKGQLEILVSRNK